MKKSFLSAMLALPLAVSSAYAQDSITIPAVKVSGFGTGALTMTNTNDAEFGRSNQTNGVKKDPRTGVDSNLGLQADSTINNWLSVTGQGLVRKDAEDDFGAELSLAFAKVKINDELSIRVGRMGIPVFMISEYRNVGYANTFVRPPQEMYAQVTFNTIDGIDAVWQHAFGDTNVTGQLSLGHTKADLAGGLRLEMQALKALNLVAEHGPFTARLGYAQGKLTVRGSTGFDTLETSLRKAGAGYRMPGLENLADQLSADSKRATFTSAGLGLDWHNIVAQTEYAQRRTHSYINDTSSWYVMGGYRIGKFLPYFTHSQMSVDRAINYSGATACPAGYPAACTPTLRALSAGVATLRGSGEGQGEQSTNSIGLRWDMTSSTDLKFQIDRITPKNGKGLFLNAVPGFDHAVTVGTVAVDFVF